MTADLQVSWPLHPLTLAEWDELVPDERLRFEIAEGVLSVMAKPRARHQNTNTNLTHRTKVQLPRELIALAEVEVVLVRSPLTVRVPDMVIVDRAVFETDPVQFAAADVHAVCEILSDGTRKIDRILKFAEYAEAGIPRYWIIDIDGPVTLTSYVLVDGAYELAGEFTGTAVLEAAGHPITLDLEALPRD